jgi:hypothetical protein
MANGECFTYRLIRAIIGLRESIRKNRHASLTGRNRCVERSVNACVDKGCVGPLVGRTVTVVLLLMFSDPRTQNSGLCMQRHCFGGGVELVLY